jgi:hypothetical protein
MRIFIVSNFRVDLSEGQPSDMVADDLVDLFRDDSTRCFDTESIARLKKQQGAGRFLYKISVDGRITG